jgi:hypothetical protein
MHQKHITGLRRHVVALIATCVAPLAYAGATLSGGSSCMPERMDKDALRKSVLARRPLPQSAQFLECRAIPSEWESKDDEEACSLQIDPSNFSQLVSESESLRVIPVPDTLPPLVKSMSRKLPVKLSVVYIFRHNPSRLHERYVYVSSDKSYLLFYTPVQRCFDLNQVI